MSDDYPPFVAELVAENRRLRVKFFCVGLLAGLPLEAFAAAWFFHWMRWTGGCP
jgi:hypothetical protein